MPNYLCFGVMDHRSSTLTGELNNSGGAEHCMEMGDGGNIHVQIFKGFNHSYWYKTWTVKVVSDLACFILPFIFLSVCTKAALTNLSNMT